MVLARSKAKQPLSSLHIRISAFDLAHMQLRNTCSATAPVCIYLHKGRGMSLAYATVLSTIITTWNHGLLSLDPSNYYGAHTQLSSIDLRPCFASDLRSQGMHMAAALFMHGPTKLAITRLTRKASQPLCMHLPGALFMPRACEIGENGDSSSKSETPHIITCVRR
jgi:hypothetical protein